ncbi:MAG: helix-turn-helix transcriptional regulator [Tetrasphaera sp.]|nr:helix-turn-helix transcriptional regulator [Tetrasphaera sp.]
MILVRQEIGEVLRERRLDLGLSLREVAGASAVSFGYLSELERGTKEASSEILGALTAALDLTLSGLLETVAERVGRAERMSAPVPLPLAENRVHAA